MNLTDSDATASLSLNAFYTADGLSSKQLTKISGSDIDLVHDMLTTVKTKSSVSHRWKSLVILLPPGKYYIGFKGTCGIPYKSNIAIDNVKLREVTEGDGSSSSIRLQDMEPLDIARDALQSKLEWFIPWCNNINNEKPLRYKLFYAFTFQVFRSWIATLRLVTNVCLRGLPVLGGNSLKNLWYLRCSSISMTVSPKLIFKHKVKRFIWKLLDLMANEKQI